MEGIRDFLTVLFFRFLITFHEALRILPPRIPELADEPLTSHFFIADDTNEGEGIPIKASKQMCLRRMAKRIKNVRPARPIGRHRCICYRQALFKSSRFFDFSDQ